MLTVRYDDHLKRFVLNVAKGHSAMFDVKRIEGRRWERLTNTWTTPPSLRAWYQLSKLGFAMLEYGGGRAYLDRLVTGAPPQDTSRITSPALFDFQRDGVEWLAERSHALLADEPGLGKTIQAIESMNDVGRSKIVVAPRVVLPNWREEIVKRVGLDEVSLWHVTNYEALPKLVIGSDLEFDLVVDEAHLIGNIKSRRTKLTLQLADRAKRVLLLTGTPPNRPIRLWPFFLATRERNAKEFFPWALRYTGAERNDFGWDFNGATHLDEMQDEMRHWMLRRTKQEVLTELPDKLYTTIYASGGAQKVLRDLSLLDAEIIDLVSKGHSIYGSRGVGSVQRLRVAASHAKIETTAQYVAAHLPAKVVVFCEFRTTMDMLSERISRVYNATEKNDLIILQINGDTKDVKEAERLFFESPYANVILCQYTAAGQGINLQCAATMVIHDLPWTQLQLEQAIDRIHRIGQRDSVHIVTVLSSSQVEATMLKGLREHRDAADALYVYGALQPQPLSQ